ncbi:MAG: DUF4199 domain-containing protein [Alistipes sp.]
MEKTNFWKDVSIYGTLLGIEEIAFVLLQLLKPNMAITMLNIAVFVTLLYLFTKRRATLYGDSEQGYSYGKCLKFIFWMTVLAGILCGAYEILARNFFFAARYQEITDQMIAALMQTNMYSAEQLTLMQKMITYPLMTLFSGVIGLVIKGLFFGLFIATFTKREPNIFVNNKEADE